MKRSGFFSVSLAALIALLAGSSLSCQKNVDGRSTLRFWHFWSEPKQEAALKVLVADYEHEHPNVHVELSPLQWSDGKAKLEAAFAAHQAPDIVHIGLEWVPEFATAGVLQALDSNLLIHLHEPLRPAVLINGQCMALPWVMNCRAMFMHKDMLKQRALSNLEKRAFDMTVDEFILLAQRQPNDTLTHEFGVNAYEPHNVLKKMLPFLWSSGSRMMCSVPYSSSIDDRAIAAFERILPLCRNGRIAGSRQLDEALKRGELSAWASGMWNLADSAIMTKYEVLASWPVIADTNTSFDQLSWSILSADCYAMSSSCAQKSLAEDFLRWLSRHDVEHRFCTEVPDAGFAAHTSASRDTMEQEEKAREQQYPGSSAFYRQTLRSRPLPQSPLFLESERIVEEEIMQAIYAKKSARQALTDAKSRLVQLEQSGASAKR